MLSWLTGIAGWTIGAEGCDKGLECGVYGQAGHTFEVKPSALDIDGRELAGAEEFGDRTPNSCSGVRVLPSNQSQPKWERMEGKERGPEGKAGARSFSESPVERLVDPSRN